ncbi:glycoside hydrolase family 18 protein [Pholiota molesta]|nr:glycoside hydrolase family 18 protein [Pholiota molesta]
MAPTVTIANHTTASTPRPHILYTVEVIIDGNELTTQRRYSEVLRKLMDALVSTLNDPYNLPPKRLLVTTFIPSAWADDALIKERKEGLADYLTDVLSSPKYKDQAALFEFLTAPSSKYDQKFDLEDALPSTLTRTKALTLASDVNASTVPISGTYYPDWAGSTVPPESIDYSKFDLIYFAFASPTSSSGLSFNSGAASLLKRLVTGARASAHGTRVVLSIGGWGGCYYYSQAVSTAANRTKFVSAVVSAVNTYNLDGVDFDWEFPNNAGAGQPFTPADTANFLLFLTALRVALGPSRVMSAAVSHTPWAGADGNPLSDVSAFAAQLSYVMIMNYDVWGASPTPGPNAPLGDLCKTSTQPIASAQGAFAQWTAAKFPAAQLLLGCPLYGYVSKSTKTVLTGSSLPSKAMNVLHMDEAVGEDGKPTKTFLNGRHVKDPADVEPAGEVSVTAASADLASYWGKQIAFRDIVKAGALVKKSDGNYGQAGGLRWRGINTWSLGDKAKFAKSSGMAGCCTWSLDQDDGFTLQDAIRAGLGLPK